MATEPRGNGTADQPYEISNWDEFDYIRNDLDAEYVLNNDLTEDNLGYDDIVGPNANSGKGFEPITGDFDGVLRGDGYSIEDFYIDRPTKDNVGIFESVKAGTVKNVRFLNVDITGNNRTAVVCGEMTGLIENCEITGNIVGNNKVGSATGLGIFNLGSGEQAELKQVEADVVVEGQNDVGGIGGDQGATNCTCNGTVTGSSRVGGISGSGTVSESKSTAKVDGENKVGGIVGTGGCQNSKSTGNVTGTSDKVGGIAGVAGDNATVENSYATGDVTGSNQTGGAVGKAVEGASSNTKGIYATGDVTGNNQTGGVIGELTGGSSSNLLSTSNINGNNETGGVVGSIGSQGVLNQSYALGSVTGSDKVGGAVGFTDNNINDVYVACDVSGVTTTGAFAGEVTSTGEIGNYYWNNELTIEEDGTDVSGTAFGVNNGTAGTGSGLTTAQLKGSEVTSNTTFDFTDTGNWRTVEATDQNIEEDAYPVNRNFTYVGQLKAQGVNARIAELGNLTSIDVTESTATVSGEVTEQVGLNQYAVGILYRKQTESEFKQIKVKEVDPNVETTSVSVSYELTGLEPETTYVYRVYVAEL